MILPFTAQAAEPKPLQQSEQPVPPDPPAVAPVNETQAAPDKAEKSDSKTADADKRRKRVAERKARRLAERRNRRPQEAPVMAFGGNESLSASPSFNVFDN